MTPIKSENKTKTISFGENPVESFWLEIPTASSILPNTDYSAQAKKFFDPMLKDGIICVFSEELSSRPMCELLAKMRDNRNRIYILTNDFNDELKNLDGCLMRYGGSRKIGSFILINPNSGDPSGCLFTGLLSDGSLQLSENLLLSLDPEQISVLFRYFCCQFWKYTAKERIGSGEHDTDSAPVDIYPPSGTGCDFRHLQSAWGKKMDAALITTTRLSENSFFKFDNIFNSKVISLYPGIDNELVRSLRQKNNTITAIDNACFTNSVKVGNDVWLVPKIDIASEDEVYALLLNNEQSKILDNHIDRLLQSKSRYEYFERESRKNLSGRNIVRLGEAVSQKYAISPEKRGKLELPAPPELPPKDQFDNREPDFPDDGRSVSVTFEWINVPFALPKGGAKHVLYSNWENAQKDIAARIDHIIGVIAESEAKEKTFSSKIKQILLGKQQKFKEYRNELKTLKDADYGSLEKNILQEKIKMINSIRVNAINDTGEIDEENRKARIQENISAKQEEKAISEAELSNKEKEISGVKDNRQELEKQIKAAENKNKAGNGEAEKKPVEIKQIMKKLESLNIKHQKLQNEAGEIRNKIKKIIGEIDSFEKQLKGSGSKKSEEQKKVSVLVLPGEKNSAGSMDLTKDLTVPKLERLPSVGKLYQHNGQDYLAIEYWEDYNEGKNEAQRLKVKLCAKGEK
jgi:hypothetical protein